MKGDHHKFIIDNNKDDVIRFIMTYISRDVHFHTIMIVYPNQVWKKLKTLVNKVDKSQVMQFEKELISLIPLSFAKIEDYLACMKELQLKLGEYKKKKFK
jgi:hypothetical protein